jgi:transcriptional regulator with XRE-family HTH domain
MASLTGRTDLTVLTFRGLSGALAEGRLIRTVQAWCPACLQGWRERAQRIYRPLIWNLTDLRVCPDHGVALQTKCPNCGRSHRPLTRYPWNGECPKCRGWLADAKTPNDPEAASEWCRHGAAAVAQWVSTYADRPGFASVGAFSTSVRRAVERYGWGGLSALGQVVGVDHSTVRGWADGSQVPSMASVLAMAFCFGVPVTDWLAKPVALDLREPIRRLPSHDSVPIRRRLKQWNAEELKVRLAEARAQVAYPPPTLSALCKKLGIHASQASRRVPELAKEIVEHHRFYRRTRHEIGDRVRRILVEGAINQLLNEGRSLSHTQMAKVLPDGLTLRDRRVRQLFLELRQQAERDMVEALAPVPQPENALAADKTDPVSS